MIWIFIVVPVFFFSLLILGPGRFCIRWIQAPDVPRIQLRFDLWKNICGFAWTRENRMNDYSSFVLGTLLLRIRRPLKEKSDHPGYSEKKAGKKSKIHLPCFIRRLPGMLSRILFRLFRCLKIDQFRVRGNIGLSNPALTGLAYGIIQSVKPFQNEKVDIEITPVFYQNQCECQADLVIRIVMAQLLLITFLTGLELGRTYFRCRRHERNSLWSSKNSLKPS